MYIAWLDEPDARARAAVGGKAANLMSLVRAGFPVPDGFTVTADAFVRSLARHEADHRLAALFGRLEHDVIDDADQGDTTLAEAGARARAQVLDGGPDPHVEFEVRRAYRQLCERRGRDDVAVAVRSSASAEDQLDSSFAGQQDTYLWVRGEDEVVNRMVRCWASLFNDRALTYRLQRRYPLTAVAMAVVVQEMVEPVAAGVAFTLDPATGDRSKVAIDSAFGLGESVVSGQVTPDHFVVDTVVGVIVRRTISDKTCEIVVESDAVTTRPVDEARRRLPSVPDPTVLAIARLARRLERHFGRPQDIEWAVTIEPDSTARVAVLQSRPETSWSRRRLEEATAASPGTLLDGVVGALTASVAEPRPTWGVALTDSDGPRSTLPGPFSVPAPEGAEDWATMYDASLVFGEARREHEEAAFWFRDAVHWPRPLSPFDVTMLQFSLASLGQYNARHFLVPSALGIDCRVLNGYCYLSPIPVSDPLVVAERAAEFRERAGYYYEHWDELYGAWMVRVRSAIDRLEAISFSALGDAVDFDEVRRATGLGPPHHLMRSYHELLDLALELWQYHFEFLNLGYAAYLDFFGYCKQVLPGIPDLAIAKMVAGIDVDLFRPDAELRRLAHAAVDQGLAELICAGSVEQAMASVAARAEASAWFDDFQAVQDPWFNYSNGTGMYHDDAVWRERPDIPFSFLRGYVHQLVAGDGIDTPRASVAVERDRLAEEYLAVLDPVPGAAFTAKLGLARTVYHFVENHNFYVEHWGLSVLWRKMRELSALFVRARCWTEPDDIFYLRRDEIPEALWDLVAAWCTGVAPHGPHRWPELVARRRAMLAACAATPPPTLLGRLPETINEPFTVMLWGITSESIRTWLGTPGDDPGLTGFAASPGVATGPARVVRSADDIVDVQPGEVLVTELTSPSWAPVFRRIVATVTDTGGMMSHAAIVCREYGLPAVTGTVSATTTIRTGQLVTVDGDTGRVTIAGPADGPPDPGVGGRSPTPRHTPRSPVWTS